MEDMRCRVCERADVRETCYVRSGGESDSDSHKTEPSEDL